MVGWGQQEVTPEPGTVGFKRQGTGTISAVSPWEFKVGAPKAS